MRAAAGSPTSGAWGSAGGRGGMNDYQLIRLENPYRKLRPSDTLALHRRDVAWLEERLRAEPEMPTVIVTHHAPSARSIEPGLEDYPLSPCYASHLERLMGLGRVRLWMHGHTPWPVDYLVGETRVVSNPRGYADEEAEGFVPDLVLEVEL
jgi:hypothetical protein